MNKNGLVTEVKKHSR